MTPDTHERRRAFCARLKGERERRDTSLEAIADATKVKASLLQAFERGDVSRWPKGIYRRAFFRDYVTAIGLPAGQHVAEFIELFPDREDQPALIEPVVPRTNGTSTVNGTIAAGGASSADGTAMEGPFRITLADSPLLRSPRASRVGFDTRALLQRLAPAVADAAIVLLVAFIVSRWTGLWPALGVVALTYFSLCTVILGRSLASELVSLDHWTGSGSMVLEWATKVFRQVRARAPELWRGTLQAFGRPTAVRGSALPLSRPPRSTGPAGHERSQYRPRREDAADHPADEVSKVLG